MTCREPHKHPLPVHRHQMLQTPLRANYHHDVQSIRVLPHLARSLFDSIDRL